jgi:hypothetical protein
MMGEIDRTQNVPSGAFLGVQTPPSLPEHFEKGSEPDIEARRFNVAEVP